MPKRFREQAIFDTAVMASANELLLELVVNALGAGRAFGASEREGCGRGGSGCGAAMKAQARPHSFTR